MFSPVWPHRKKQRCLKSVSYFFLAGLRLKNSESKQDCEIQISRYSSHVYHSVNFFYVFFNKAAGSPHKRRSNLRFHLHEATRSATTPLPITDGIVVHCNGCVFKTVLLHKTHHVVQNRISDGYRISCDIL